MVSLLPSRVLDELRQRFGDKLDQLSEIQRLALATVAIEGKVTHGRLKSMSADHPRDITIALASLVRAHLLESNGTSGKGTYYTFPGEHPAEIDEFSSERSVGKSEHSLGNSEHYLDLGSEHSAFSSEHWVRLKSIASRVSNRGRIPREEMEATILALCENEFVSLRQMSELLNRAPDSLRVHYLNHMVNSGSLVYKHPEKPNHPNQAYKARS